MSHPRWRATIVLLALFGPLPPIAFPQAEEANLSTITGRVIDDTTGLPIQGAKVGYQSKALPGGKSGPFGSATSDAQGQFRFPNVPPGDYFLVAFSNEHVQRVSKSLVTVAAGQDLSAITFRLIPFAGISGRITDQEKKPLAGIQVSLWRITYFGGQRGLRVDKWGNTDADGFFRIGDMAPGRYYLCAAPSDLIPKTPASRPHYVQSYYPGTFDPEAAAPIDLLPGIELKDIGFKLSKASTVRVSGRVLSPNIANVTLLPDGFLFNSSVTTKSSAEDGRFEFEDVLPGLYRLRVHIKPEGQNAAEVQETWATQSLPVGPTGVVGLKLTPLPSPSITGHVHIDGASDGVDLSKFVIELWQVDRGAGGVTTAVTANQDGIFRIDDLQPGRYRLVSSQAPAGFYLKTVSAGNKELPDRVLDLNFSAPIRVDVTMSPKSASVTGNVYPAGSEQGAAEATVVLVPQDPYRKDDEFAYLRTTSDGTGKFVIHDVPPGEYRAYAWETVDSYNSVYMDPYFIGPLANRSVAVILSEGDRTNIKLTLITDR
jgi:Carboxypeptidase regulatory-like domain/Prealbumin-like fold domain